MDLNCIDCAGYLISGDWDTLGSKITCKCGGVWQVEYDEEYDPTTGEEYGWFYLDRCSSNAVIS